MGNRSADSNYELATTIDFSDPQLTTLDEAYVRTQTVTAGDLNAVKDRITSLRSSIGASPANFRETPAVGMPVRAIHMEDLRAGAR